MKYALILASILFLAYCAFPQKKTQRHFFIGFQGMTAYGATNYGNYDFSLDHYPTKRELIDSISAQQHIDRVVIFSICEQTKPEHDIFWR